MRLVVVGSSSIRDPSLVEWAILAYLHRTDTDLHDLQLITRSRPVGQMVGRWAERARISCFRVLPMLGSVVGGRTLGTPEMAVLGFMLRRPDNPAARPDAVLILWDGSCTLMRWFARRATEMLGADRVFAIRTGDLSLPQPKPITAVG